MFTIQPFNWPGKYENRISLTLLCYAIHQVLRYSALFGGIFYGFWHQSTLNTQAKQAEYEREYKHKESLIQKAKAEWAKKNAPPETKSGRMCIPLAVSQRRSISKRVSKCD